jgi:hypothetical protein
LAVGKQTRQDPCPAPQHLATRGAALVKRDGCSATTEILMTKANQSSWRRPDEPQNQLRPGSLKLNTLAEDKKVSSIGGIFPATDSSGLIRRSRRFQASAGPGSVVIARSTGSGAILVRRDRPWKGERKTRSKRSINRPTMTASSCASSRPDKIVSYCEPSPPRVEDTTI